MTLLIFECPRTHRVIDAGIQTDMDTLAAVSSATLRLSCPHCCSTHELPIKYGRLSVACIPEVLAEPETPKAPVLAVAINALRIFWLQQGLTVARTGRRPILKQGG
jgi:hypothetical protein